MLHLEGDTWMREGGRRGRSDDRNPLLKPVEDGWGQGGADGGHAVGELGVWTD
jgi:hypothetical protein